VKPYDCPTRRCGRYRRGRRRRRRRHPPSGAHGLSAPGIDLHSRETGAPAWTPPMPIPTPTSMSAQDGCDPGEVASATLISLRRQLSAALDRMARAHSGDVPGPASSARPPRGPFLSQSGQAATIRTRWAIRISSWRRPRCRTGSTHDHWTRIEMVGAILEYLEIFHNRQRHHSALGMRTPIEYETIQHDNHPLALRNQAS
jgi:transposase InsO family protein